MALLKIIKLSNKTWKHNSDVDGDFILTKFYAKQEDNNFLLVESYGSKRRKYLINEIEVYDIGGSVETFANFSTLFLRLEALSYPAFYEDGVFIFNPNDYISSDSGNILVLGTDNNFFVPSSGGGGSTTFTGLTDTPSTYTGQAGKVATVNATEDALEFTEVSGGTQYPKVILFENNSSGSIPNLTGTVATTILSSYIIPANTIPANSNLRMTLKMKNSGTTSQKYVYVTWSNVDVGTKLFSPLTSFTNNTRDYLKIQKSMLIKGGNAYTPSLTNQYSDLTSDNLNSFAFDVTVDNTIYVWGRLGNVADTLIFDCLILEILA